MRLQRQPRANSIGMSIVHFLIYVCLLPFIIGASASELVFSNYQFGDLRLSYQPPRNDGGEQITKYKVEWDASQNNAHLPSFTPSSPCSGTFALSLGGRMSMPLNVDVTSDDLEVAIKELLGYPAFE
eukprot:scaffold1064_cov209-Skeletonema_marinoi.AAC.2